MTGRSVVVVLVVLGVAAGGSAAAYPRPGHVERVSVAHDGGVVNAAAANAALSDDGRFVAFTSAADNLVPGDRNAATDVFVRDRRTGTTERVSVDADGAEAKGSFSSPDISRDGRYVAFSSSAALVAEDRNQARDVYVYDRWNASPVLASLGDGGTLLPGGGSHGDVSDDGQVVSFVTTAALVAGDRNGTFDVYVHDRRTARTTLASATAAGTSGNSAASSHSLSGDGGTVVWWGDATDYVEEDRNGAWDVFARDLRASTTSRVSVSTAGGEGNADSQIGYAPVVSRDGQVVVFQSYASNLVPGRLQPLAQIYVRDRRAQTTERVSVASDGGEPDDYSLWPTISADGRYVGFLSYAGNLDARDANGLRAQDYFLHDRATGTTELITIGDSGAQPTTGYINVVSAVAEGGVAVAFALEDGALDAADTNGVYDVYVRERGPELGVGGLAAAAEGDDVDVSGWAAFAGTTVIDVADRPDDAQFADIVPARAAGAELTGFAVTYRPERGDLLLRWRVAELPAVHAPGGIGVPNSIVGPGLVPGVAGAPAIMYGWGYTVDGVRYELRVARAAVVAVPPGAPYAALYRCAPRCEETHRLGASVGGTGLEVRTAVPLAALGAPAALPVSRAQSTLSEPGSGVRSGGDGVMLPGAALPPPRLALAAGPADAAPDGLAWGEDVPLDDGRFTASLPGAAARGAVWARTCLGARCTFAGVPIG